MKKDYNTVIPMRKAMFRHLNKAIIVQYFKGVCNAVTVAMATIQRRYCTAHSLLRTISHVISARIIKWLLFTTILQKCKIGVKVSECEFTRLVGRSVGRSILPWVVKFCLYFH